MTNNVTLVIHDWGSALGFDWARRNADRVKAFAYGRHVRPVLWEEWNQQSRPVFEGFGPRRRGNVPRNVFVEKVLPVLRRLTEAEMTVYRRPFLDLGEDRRPTLSWPRQTPMAGETRGRRHCSGIRRLDGNERFAQVARQRRTGRDFGRAQREFCRGWENQTEVTARGSHFIQEDSPTEIGEALHAWLSAL